MQDAHGQYTLCWKCSKSFSPAELKCPHCGATNGIVNYEDALLEMQAEFKGFERRENNALGR